MANILDYLDWRGDLTLAQSPFNDVDNLILAELSYLDFSNVVPPMGGGSIPLAQAAEELFERYPLGEKMDMGLIVPDEVPVMLDKMRHTARFCDMKLSCYTDHVDAARAEQFSAITVETGDKQIYCSYRGTDDTLAGWREDLELACDPEVPAQKMAVDYVTRVARRYPRRGIRLGGHSKGGNLAAYAGVFCPPNVQKRITTVYSNDGPGFHDDILDTPAHDRVEDRIRAIVPKSSVVGLLLEHEKELTVVDSDQLGFWQHDPFSWQVMGGDFIVLPGLEPEAEAGSRAIREWHKNLSREELLHAVDALFSVLTAAGAETLTDLKEDNIRAVGPMARAMKDMDKKTREGLVQFMQLLFKSNARMVLEGIRHEAEKLIPSSHRE